MFFNISVCPGIVCHILDIPAEVCERNVWGFFPILIMSSNKRLEKLLMRETLSQIGNGGGDCFNAIWGQIVADSAWVHRLLDCLRKNLVDVMEQSERLACREINGRGAYGRWLRRIYPNRISCTKVVLLFYTELDWWCPVVSGQGVCVENRLHLSDLAEDQAHYSFVFPWTRMQYMLVIKLVVSFYSVVSI